MATNRRISLRYGSELRILSLILLLSLLKADHSTVMPQQFMQKALSTFLVVMMVNNKDTKLVDSMGQR